MKYLFLIMLWLLTMPLAAKANEDLLEDILKKPILTNADRDELFRQGFDDPESLIRNLARIWKESLSPENNLMKARAGYLIGFFIIDIPNHPDIDVSSIFSETERLVTANKLSISLKELHFLKTRYETDDIKVYYQLSDLVHHIDDLQIKAFLMAIIAFNIADRDSINKRIPRLIGEVQHLRENFITRDSPLEVATLQNLLSTLRVIEHKSEMDGLARKLSSACEQKKLRYLCSGFYYNQGRYFIEKNEIASGIPYILKAQEFAEQANDIELLAFCNYSLSLAYTKAKEFKAAIFHSQKAADLFEKIKDPDAMATSLRSLSESYRLSGQLDASLTAAEKALKVSPPNHKNNRRLEIYEELSKVHEALGQFERAYYYLGIFVELQKDLLTADAGKKYMQLRNETLSEQNELQAGQIQLLGKFRIVSMVAGGLSLLVCAALILVGRQTSVIKRSRQKMKEVLDHIEEGILMLGEDLRIKSGYSPHLDKILSRQPGSLADALFLELLFPTKSGCSGQGVIAKETLQACLGSDELSWDFNNAHLPTETQYGDSVLALHWQPLFNAKGLITRVLVSVRDITSLRAIEKKAREESERVQLMQKKLEEVLGGKIPRIRTLLAELRGEWTGLGESVLQPEHQPAALRRLHTWKGAARTLGLKLLAAGIHEMESALIPSAGLSPLQIGDRWKALSLSFEDYEQLVHAFQISQGDGEAAASDLYAYANLYAADMKERLSEAGCPQKGLMVMDHVLDWKPEVLSVVHEMLLHAVSNAMDHGFIRPLEKNESVRPALIRIEALPRGSYPFGNLAQHDIPVVV